MINDLKSYQLRKDYIDIQVINNYHALLLTNVINVVLAFTYTHIITKQ